MDAETAELHAAIVRALCTDHGHVSRTGGLDCRTCLRRAHVVLAVIAAELDRLRAIEDRANRVVANIPDPSMVKAARFILDGHAGKWTPTDS